MYSKQEAALLRQEFWTVFGQYLAPLPSAEGEKINWINYKTGEKDIQFKMNAEQDEARVGIELSHKDTDVQQIFFDQLQAFKTLLHSTLGEEWQWSAQHPSEHGKIISSVSTTIQGPRILNRADWPALIQFFKPRIMALDEFWSNVKYAFESLR